MNSWIIPVLVAIYDGLALFLQVLLPSRLQAAHKKSKHIKFNITNFFMGLPLHCSTVMV